MKSAKNSCGKVNKTPINKQLEATSELYYKKIYVQMIASRIPI